MAKRKKPVSASTRTKPKANRAGVPQTFYLSQEGFDALERFLGSHDGLEVTKTSVFETALRLYLQSKGFWPPKPDQS